MERKRGMGGGGVRESEREEESEGEGFRERASERMCWLTLSLFIESDKERERVPPSCHTARRAGRRALEARDVVPCWESSA